jgi:hypothetical protein
MCSDNGISNSSLSVLSIRHLLMCSVSDHSFKNLEITILSSPIIHRVSNFMRYVTCFKVYQFFINLY